MVNKKALAPIVVTNASIGGAILALDANTIYNIDAQWPASLAGTIDVQASNDGINWYDIANTSQTMSGSAAGSYMWNFTSAGYTLARLYVTYSSGSGTITASGSAKGA